MKRLITQYAGMKKEIYILCIGRLVTAMGSFVWPMLTFFLTKKLGFSSSITSTLLAAATILMLPVALWGGKLADKYSRKNIIIIFDTLTVSFYTAASILPIGNHTAVMIFIAGLFQTAEDPAYGAIMADFSATKDRERAFSLSYLSFNLGYILGASVAGVLFAKHVSLAFLLNGLAVGTSTVLIALFVHPKNAVAAEHIRESYGVYEQPVDERLSILTVLKDRKVVLLMLVVGCLASMPNTVMGILLPLQLGNAMGDTGAAIYGYLNSLNGLVVIVFTPLLTILLARFTEIPKCAAGLALFTLGLVFFCVGAPVGILFVGMFIFTLGEVVDVLGANPYSSKRIPASHRGRLGGISSVVYSLFSALIQFIIGRILRSTGDNFRLIWIIFIVCSTGAVFLYGLAYRPDRRTFPLLYGKDRI